MGHEPKKHTKTHDLHTTGNLQLTFTGEQYDGQPILDTQVSITAGTICWITWEDREKFLAELDEIIQRYRM